MSAFQFQNLSIQTLSLTEKDNPSLVAEADTLILKAQQDGQQLIFKFPASVLVPFMKQTFPSVPKEVEQEVKKPVRLIGKRGGLKKGTHINMGEENPNHRLTTQEVREIKMMLSDKDFTSRYETNIALCRDIGAAYHVDPTHIYRINRGERWGHLVV